MAPRDDEKNTPEDLFTAFSSDKTWNLCRVYRVSDGKRGPWLRDLDPNQLPDVRSIISKELGAGSFDLELAKHKSNTKGRQCRVDVEIDGRPPHLQQQGQHAPPGAMVPSPQPMWPAQVLPPGFGGFMPPGMVSPEMMAMREQMAELRAELRARSATDDQRRDDFTQSLLRDLILERHKAGNQFLVEQRSTWEQAFQFGQKLRGGGTPGWDNPQAVMPILNRGADLLEKILTKRAAEAPAQQQQPAGEDETAKLTRFVIASIKERVPPAATIGQVRALFGDANFRDLVEQRTRFVQHFTSHPDVEPMLADVYVANWLREAVAKLDELGGTPAGEPPAQPPPAQPPPAQPPPALTPDEVQ